jgi:hypothetical protein
MKDLNITEKNEIATTEKNVVETLTKAEIAKVLKEKAKAKAKKATEIEKAKKAKLKEKATNSKNKLVANWLLKTKGLNAIITYVNDERNAKDINRYLKDFNANNTTNFESKNINKQIIKFAHLHESNDLDFDGNVLNRKSLFTISFFVDTLLKRKAKYNLSTNSEFKKFSTKSTENYLQKKYENKVNTFKYITDENENTIDKSNEVNLFIDNLISKDANITKQEIINALTENFTE